MSSSAAVGSSGNGVTSPKNKTPGGGGAGGNGSGGPKSYRNKKKIDEVKEIIQNRSDAEIARVLECFDNDVGRCIDAFVTDGGKEALAKWAEKKKAAAKKPAEQPSDQARAPGEAGGSGEEAAAGGGKKGNRSKRAKANKPAQAQNGAAGKAPVPNRNNYISDLVSSIIDQYTGPNAAAATTSSASSDHVLAPAPAVSKQPPQQQQQANLVQSQQLVDDLNRLVLSTATNSTVATISGLKVTVMGIQNTGTANGHHHVQANVNSTAQTISSVSSSPSSMSSSSSSFDARHTLPAPVLTNGSGRPSLLELKTNATPAPLPQRTFNKQINNPKARELLEKPQKDLQRQSAVLSKIATVFQEEAAKSQQLLVQTFAQLHKLLDQRQSHMQAQLAAAVQTGSDLLRLRQAKAASLKFAADNSVHLSDDETLELKADIKHFVSERQLDEEFGKLKLFDADAIGCKELIESIQRAGSVPVLTSKYAKQRPPLNELLSASATPAATTPLPVAVNGKTNGGAKQPLANGHYREHLDTNNNNRNPASAPVVTTTNGGHNGVHKNNNGNGVLHDDSGEGEFIEVKKSRRNKPKLQQQSVAEPQAVKPTPVAATNGHHQHQNGAKAPSNGGGQPPQNGAKLAQNGPKPPRNQGGRQEVRAH